MRSAAQLSRTPREWLDHKALERERLLRELERELVRAREQNAPWYLWIVARTQGRHLHALHDESSRVVACPVPGCDAGRGTLTPHSSAKRK